MRAGRENTRTEEWARSPSASQLRRLNRKLKRIGAKFPKCGAVVGKLQKREGKKPVHHPANGKAVEERKNRKCQPGRLRVQERAQGLGR